MTFKIERSGSHGVCHRAETELPCETRSAGRARHWLAAQLAAMYGALDVAAEDMVLVVSELVANCIKAEAHQFTLAVEAHHAFVRVAAVDDAPGLPVLGGAAPDAPGGRGLVIVDALSLRWGVTPGRDSKTVWAELPVPSSAAPRFACSVA
jgi:hypothetical protein